VMVVGWSFVNQPTLRKARRSRYRRRRLLSEGRGRRRLLRKGVLAGYLRDRATPGLRCCYTITRLSLFARC
jgi:hypothetical protein